MFEPRHDHFFPEFENQAFSPKQRRYFSLHFFANFTKLICLLHLPCSVRVRSGLLGRSCPSAPRKPPSIFTLDSSGLLPVHPGNLRECMRKRMEIGVGYDGEHVASAAARSGPKRLEMGRKRSA